MVRLQEEGAFAVEAWISRRRPISKALAFLDLACDDPSAPPLQALLKLQAWRPTAAKLPASDGAMSLPQSHTEDEAAFKAFHRVLQPGARVRLEGCPGSTRVQGEGILVVSDATLLAPPTNPQHIVALLRAARTRALPPLSVARSLGLVVEDGGGADEAVSVAEQKLDELLCSMLGTEDLDLRMRPVDREIVRRWKRWERGTSRGIQRKAERKGPPPHVVALNPDRGSVPLPALPAVLRHPPPHLLLAKGERTAASAAGLGVKDGAVLSPSQVLNVSHEGGAAVVEGWVQGRRRFVGNVTIVDLVDQSSSTITAHIDDDDDDDDDDDEIWAGKMKGKLTDKTETHARTTPGPRNLEAVGEASRGAHQPEKQAPQRPMTALTTNWKSRLRCIFHPATFGQHSDGDGVGTKAQASLGAYAELCAHGAEVRLHGMLMVPSATSVESQHEEDLVDAAQPEPWFWVQKAELKRCSWRPKALKQLLKHVNSSHISPSEAAGAVGSQRPKADGHRRRLGGDDGGDGSDGAHAIDEVHAMRWLASEASATEQQWRVKELSQRLMMTDGGASTRVGTLTPAQRRILGRFAPLREKWPAEFVPPSSRAASSTASWNDGPTTELDQTSRDSSCGRYASTGSWMSNNKRPQIEWMLNQIAPYVDAAANGKNGCGGSSSGDSSAHRRLPLRVLDIGGGKGFLANAVAARFGDKVQVRIIDVARAAVRSGEKSAAKKGLLGTHVRYSVADASNCLDLSRLCDDDDENRAKGVFIDDSKNGKAGNEADWDWGRSTEQYENGGIDLVIALHACGSLSDVAIALAVRNGAGFVVCPCCYCAHRNLSIPATLRHNEERAGLAKDTTTGLTQRSSAAQWLSMGRDADLLKLQLAAELQGDSGKGGAADQAARTLCALRAEAAIRAHQELSNDGANCSSISGGSARSTLNVAIRQFPVAFSNRNLCLVGQQTPS